jgi:AcrR family transcriptional regulator
VSRAEGPARIVDAALRLGAASGASALSLQGVADAAGVSKALVLYHFGDKPGLLSAVVTALSRDSAARLDATALARDPMEAWRSLAVDECRRGEAPLLAALVLEPSVAAAVVVGARTSREAAATAAAKAILTAVGLAPRVPIAFVGRLLLRELDGLASASARRGLSGGALEAELDAALLALLALGS